MVVLWTKDGQDSQWVNREVGIAQAANKLVIPVVEEGTDPNGVWAHVEYVKLNREDPDAAIGRLTGYFGHLKAKRETRKRRLRQSLLFYFSAAHLRNLQELTDDEARDP